MEKRRCKRINKRLAVEFGNNGTLHSGITNDISRTGLFIKTTHVYSPGSVVKVNLLLPNNGSTTFTGRVVRTLKHPPYSSLAHNGVGIECKFCEESSYLAYITSIEG